MKRVRLVAATIFFAALLAASAIAQSKIVVVDTRAFDDKTGITKYVTGMNTLESEFGPLDNEIKALATRYQALADEIKKLQATNPMTDTVAATVRAKLDEYGKLERDIKFKQEDAKARYQSRYSTVMGPIMQDISKALQDYAKAKGYSLILDGAKLDEAQLVLAFDPAADATKEFITFYNARPAGTAAATPTAPPK